MSPELTKIAALSMSSALLLTVALLLIDTLRRDPEAEDPEDFDVSGW